MKATRFVFAALLASAAATPAFSQEEPRGERGRGERVEAGDRARPQGWSGERRGGGDWQQRRVEQQQQQVQAQAVAPPAAPQQAAPQQAQRDWSGNRGNGWQGRGSPVTVAPRDAPPAVQPQAQAQSNGWRGRGNWNGGQGVRVESGRTNPVFNNGGNWAQRDRDHDGIRNNRDWDRNNDGRVDRRWDGNRNGVVDRRFDQNRDGVRDRGQWNSNRGWNQNGNANNRGNWNREWRQDNRYDWQRYRYANRDRYRLPRYYSPYGYSSSYQRFGIGIYLDDLFFSSRYQISDPWQYRLPPAEWPYEWVRYYDDVLLVDTETGYVADVIYDFFL